MDLHDAIPGRERAPDEVAAMREEAETIRAFREARESARDPRSARAAASHMAGEVDSLTEAAARFDTGNVCGPSEIASTRGRTRAYAVSMSLTTIATCWNQRSSLREPAG